MSGFPRSTWPRSVRGPLPCENWSIFRIQWAAHDASHAWAEAEATRRWDRVDRPCFLLAVYDRAEELERRWQRDEIPLPFDTYEQWQASLNEFLAQACEEAWQALDDAEDSALPGHSPTLDPPGWPEVEKFCLDVFSLYFDLGFHAYTGPMHLEDTNPDDIGSFDPNLKYDEYKNTTVHIIPWSRFGCPSDDSGSESDSDSDATSTSGHNDANAKQKATGGLKNSLAKTLRRKRKHSADSEDGENVEQDGSVRSGNEEPRPKVRRRHDSHNGRSRGGSTGAGEDGCDGPSVVGGSGPGDGRGEHDGKDAGDAEDKAGSAETENHGGVQHEDGPHGVAECSATTGTNDAAGGGAGSDVP